MKFLIFLGLAGVCFANTVPRKVETYEENFERLSKELNGKQKEWQAGYNKKFHGKSMDDLKTLCGTKLDMELPEPEVHAHTEPRSLPASFDARQQWPNCKSLTHIRDQANCGSCWAVAAAEVATDRICIHSNGASNPDISAENLMACCSTCGQGCNGGYPIKAMQYWESSGIVTGGDYGSSDGCQPYQIKPCGESCQGEAKTPKCAKTCEASYKTPYSNDLHKASKAYSVAKTQTAIMNEIFTNGPVEAAFTVYEDFFSYTSGVYHHVSGSVAGGHAVKILGWGNLNNTPYWLVANSWNSDWGQDGYFMIRRGTNECGIEAGIVAAIPSQ
jgi:cathepsin B